MTNKIIKANIYWVQEYEFNEAISSRYSVDVEDASGEESTYERFAHDFEEAVERIKTMFGEIEITGEDEW